MLAIVAILYNICNSTIHKKINKKSHIAILTFIHIICLPQISPFPNDLSHINFHCLTLMYIELHSRSMNSTQILQNTVSGGLDVFGFVLIFHARRREVDCVLGVEVDTVLVLGDLVGDLYACDY